MEDWGAVLVATLLFVLLTPGLIFQLPGKGRAVEFGNFQTSPVSICHLLRPGYHFSHSCWCPYLTGCTTNCLRFASMFSRV
ncbi:hypothetical protein Leryth_004198 [Lithospermum erythrorhizon]|nr:hypothetical protein Leryth_004198 [Lithospermum erythrorhizon]